MLSLSVGSPQPQPDNAVRYCQRNDLTDGAILGGPMRLAEGFETISVDGKYVGQVFSGLNDRQRRSVYYYSIFPNMLISAHPDYVMVHHIERISNDRSAVSCHFLSPPQERTVTIWHGPLASGTKLIGRIGMFAD